MTKPTHIIPGDPYPPSDVLSSLKLVIHSSSYLSRDFLTVVEQVEVQIKAESSEDSITPTLREWLEKRCGIDSLLQSIPSNVHIGGFCQIVAESVIQSAINSISEEQWLELYRWGLSKLED